MGLLDFFQQLPERTSTSEKVIGKAECSTENVSSIFMGMVHSMGMASPKTLVGKAPKGIKITKKGDTYTLILSMYKPPLQISWTGAIPMDKLIAVLDRVAQDNKRIGYVNTITTAGGHSYFQLAVA